MQQRHIHVGGAELDDLAPSPPAWPRYGARRPGSLTGVCIGDPMQALPFDGWPGSATGLYLYVISSHSPGGEHPEVRGLVILPGGIQWLLPSPANVPYGSRRWGLLVMFCRGQDIYYGRWLRSGSTSPLLLSYETVATAVVGVAPLRDHVPPHGGCSGHRPHRSMSLTGVAGGAYFICFVGFLLKPNG